MKAMILAAGRGERLRPLTDRMPKPMIPIASEPLITHQIRWLQRAGVTEVVINLHHLGEQIQSHLGSGRDLGVSIRYSLEEELLDTGGGIVKALPLLGEAPFLLLNGDIWSNFRFVSLVDAMPETGHVVLTPTPAHRKVSDFGLDGTRVWRLHHVAEVHHFPTGPRPEVSQRPQPQYGPVGPNLDPCDLGTEEDLGPRTRLPCPPTPSKTSTGGPSSGGAVGQSSVAMGCIVLKEIKVNTLEPMFGYGPSRLLQLTQLF